MIDTEYDDEIKRIAFLVLGRAAIRLGEPKGAGCENLELSALVESDDAARDLEHLLLRGIPAIETMYLAVHGVRGCPVVSVDIRHGDDDGESESVEVHLVLRHG